MLLYKDIIRIVADCRNISGNNFLTVAERAVSMQVNPSDCVIVHNIVGPIIKKPKASG